MSVLANEIEKYLKMRLADSSDGILELRRIELAEIFACVPSQINYVLETRFANYHGYHVESRRGGGGYIRIVKLAPARENDLSEIMAMIDSTMGKQFSLDAGISLIARLSKEGFLTKRESMLVSSQLSAVSSLRVPAYDAAVLRSVLLRAVLVNLLRNDFADACEEVGGTKIQTEKDVFGTE